MSTKVQNEMAVADPDSILGLAHSMKQLADKQLNWFVNDGEGNIMYWGLDEITAYEYASRFPGYSVGR